MGDNEREPDGLWERGWDGHARMQRQRLAALSLEEKIRWLEEAQRLVEQITLPGQDPIAGDQ
ncbi:MAG: hypothetical protein M0R80_24590 [Proteobacteria bacterium]|nr:hypothetical protein [Pseudomonadota bacterium]